MEIHCAQIGTEIGVSQHSCLASLSLLDMGGMFWGSNGDGDRAQGSSMDRGGSGQVPGKKKPSPSQTWFGVMIAFLLLFTLGFVAVLG